MKITLKVAAVSVAALASLSMTACNRDQAAAPGGEGSGGKPVVIGLAVANLQADFFNQIKQSVDAEAKARALRHWAADAGIPLRQTIAIGDGANDLRMMGEAGLAIAFNAKPRVRAEADLVIQHQDLAQVLPLLGLRG